MKNKKIIAVIFAVMAAGLYAISMPISKLLLNKIDPTLLAALLYLGAGSGIGVLKLFSKKNNTSEKISKNDLPYVIGMVVLDIIAPILLMIGLKNSLSTNASLLNNFEIVCTSLIALIIFKEYISRKMWIAIILITISSFVLSIDLSSTFTFSWGSLLILLATLAWGFENNCTRNLADKDTYVIVIIKGLFSGLGSLIVSLILKENIPYFIYIFCALLLGFIAYGLSIFFYIKAQGKIGASKTSAFYSLAPFIGTFLSFILLGEKLSFTYYIGLLIMIIGTAIVVKDTLQKGD